MPAQSTLDRLRVATTELIRSSRSFAERPANRKRREALEEACAATEAALNTKRGRPVKQ